jgi:hypothetical protein
MMASVSIEIFHIMVTMFDRLVGCGGQVQRSQTVTANFGQFPVTALGFSLQIQGSKFQDKLATYHLTHVGLSMAGAFDAGARCLG